MSTLNTTDSAKILPLLIHKLMYFVLGHTFYDTKDLG
jgi:hypothetical protein